MSLVDGRQKMSKSSASEASRINLLDDADTIARKVKKAKSDAVDGGITAGLELQLATDIPADARPAGGS